MLRSFISTVSISVKIMAVFICLWLILSAASLGAVTYASRQVTAKILANTDQKTQYFANMINNDIIRINQQLYTLANDIDVHQFYTVRAASAGFSYPEWLSYYNAHQKLRLYLQSSPYISDLFLVLPDNGEALSASRSLINLEEPELSAVNSDSSEPRAVMRDDQITYLARGSNNVTMGVQLSFTQISAILRSLDEGAQYRFLFIGPDNSLPESLRPDELTRAVHAAVFSGGEPGKHVTVDGERYMIGAIPTYRNGFQIISYMPERALYTDVYYLRWIFWATAVIAFVAPTVAIWQVRRTIHAPMRRLVNAMKRVENGDYRVMDAENEKGEFCYVFTQFNQMSAKLESLINQVLEGRLQAQRAQIKQLQSQINPHFLFNSLYIGYRMAQDGDTDNVAALCMYLGDYFKFVTYMTDSNIPLKDELVFTESYLRINKLRFPSRFEYRIESEPELDGVLVPNMIIQPLIENALIHGVERGNRRCSLTLGIRRSGGSLEFVAENDGGGMGEREIAELYGKLRETRDPQKSYGLWNVNRRLKYLYGEGAALVIESPDENTFRVSFKVPIGGAACTAYC